MNLNSQIKCVLLNFLKLFRINSFQMIISLFIAGFELGRSDVSDNLIQVASSNTSCHIASLRVPANRRHGYKPQNRAAQFG